MLADNKLALNAGWDKEILAIELQGLIDLDFEVELTGFSLAEIDFVLDEASNADPDGVCAPEDEVPVLGATAISRAGDLWQLGRHRLLCGDARSQEVVASPCRSVRVSRRIKADIGIIIFDWQRHQNMLGYSPCRYLAQLHREVDMHLLCFCR